MNRHIFVAGHQGMVGSAIIRRLSADSEINIITASRNQCDLTNQNDVLDFIQNNRIDEVYIAAARVGGIKANSENQYEFLYENLMIESNLINACYINGIKKLLFMGSSCIYPKHSKQPIKEEALLSDYLEPTNQGYALAKISGIKMCEYISQESNFDYRSIMPTNLYGPNDNYHLENSHVIPGLIHKFYNAKKNSTDVMVWGSGDPLREFLHVDDLARAAIFINSVDQKTYLDCINNDVSHLNVGSGEEVSIKELAIMMSEIFNFDGKIKFDIKKPDGMKRKLLDCSRLLSLGWRPEIDLRSGLKSTIAEFKALKESNL